MTGHCAVFVSVLLAIATTTTTSVSATYVPDLGSHNFASVVDGTAHTLLEFYAPWCGHCKKLAPEYAKVGELFGASKDVVVAQVDADKHKGISSKWGVTGYPTLKFLPKGKTDPSDAEDVKAERTAEGLTDFLNSRIGSSKKIVTPPTKVITLTEDNFDDVVKDTSKGRMVEFFAPWCGHCKKLAPIYDRLAELFDEENDIAITALDMDAHRSLGEPYGVTGFPTLKFFPKGQAEPVKYEGGRDLESLVKYISGQTGKDIAEDGGVIDGAGIVDSMASFVKMFVTGSKDDAAVGAKEAAAKLEGRAADNAAYYLKVMKNTLSKGPQYPETESARLTKILESSAETLTVGQKRSFRRRINSLSVFIGSNGVGEGEL